jgi:hypothetical protein
MEQQVNYTILAFVFPDRARENEIVCLFINIFLISSVVFRPMFSWRC